MRSMRLQCYRVQSSVAFDGTIHDSIDCSARNVSHYLKRTIIDKHRRAENPSPDLYEGRTDSGMSMSQAHYLKRAE